MDIKALPDCELYVRNLFTRFAKPYLLYHNLEHTEQVVNHAHEIAQHYGLAPEATYVVITAAWFHDTGHLLGNMANHEELGVRIMRECLYGKQVAQAIVDHVAKCIQATKMPVHPVSLVEKILCDADTWHLGTADFKQTDRLVWQEMELRLGKTIDHQQEHSLRFLEEHTFFTDYCQELLNAGKLQNIESLKSLIKG